MPDPQYLYKKKEILNPDPKKPKIVVHEYVCLNGCDQDILQEYPSGGYERSSSIPATPITLYYCYHTPIAPEVYKAALDRYQQAKTKAREMTPLEKGEMQLAN